jgi:hypothetical protein
MYGKKHTQETIQKIIANRATPIGKEHRLSKCYELTCPEYKKYILYGGELDNFCKQHNLSIATFRKNLSNGWPPSKRGKNVGWSIKIKE